MITIEERAKEFAGNWRGFDSFCWADKDLVEKVKERKNLSIQGTFNGLDSL